MNVPDDGCRRRSRNSIDRGGGSSDGVVVIHDDPPSTTSLMTATIISKLNIFMIVTACCIISSIEFVVFLSSSNTHHNNDNDNYIHNLNVFESTYNNNNGVPSNILPNTRTTKASSSLSLKDDSSISHLTHPIMEATHLNLTNKNKNKDKNKNKNNNKNNDDLKYQYPHHHPQQHHVDYNPYKQTHQYDLLLDVPFYIYEEFDWLNDTSTTTTNNTTSNNDTTTTATVGPNHTLWEWIHTPPSERNHPTKHESDIRLYLAARDHPFRVYDPSQAKLFVVPSLTSLWQIEHVYHSTRFTMCFHGICGGQNLMIYVNDVLQQSTWYQRSNGKDHIVFLTYMHWKHPKWNHLPSQSRQQQQQRQQQRKQRRQKYEPIVNQTDQLEHSETKRQRKMSLSSLYPTISRCNVIQFGQGNPKWNDHDRLSLDTMYVGTPCYHGDGHDNNHHQKYYVPYDNKTSDLVLVGKLQPKAGKWNINRQDHKYVDRRNICEWTGFNNNRQQKSSNNDINTDEDDGSSTTTTSSNEINLYTNESNVVDNTYTRHYSMDVCGYGVQCPTIANAKLDFHVRGDTISANRLFDLLLSGTVPIFTYRRQYTAHASFIDWSRLSFFIDMSSNHTTTTGSTTNNSSSSLSLSSISTNNKRQYFQNTLDRILADDELIRQKTYETIVNRDLYDFHTPVPFDTYMYMFRSFVYPQSSSSSPSSKLPPTKYSALILPLPS